MNTSLLLFSHKSIAADYDILSKYYTEAGPDYQEWSPNLNMHFGYYRTGMNPFDRESMLQEMNRQVFKRLGLEQSSEGTILDMGCGVGASLDQAISEFPKTDGIGISIVPWQIQQARKKSRATFVLGDYTNIKMPSNSVDFVYAIESSCYASGSSKSDLLSEMYRLLKPEGRFVIADGFLKTHRPMGRILNMAYRQLCKSWALQELGNIHDCQTAATRIGFSEITTENISWKVAPSVAHVPYTVLRFLFRSLLKRDELSKERWDNLKSPLLTMVLGLHQRHFGYYLLSGTKSYF